MKRKKRIFRMFAEKIAEMFGRRKKNKVVDDEIVDKFIEIFNAKLKSGEVETFHLDDIADWD